MIKKNYSKFEVKEEFGTLSFNNVLLYREDTKCTKLFFNHYLPVYLLDKGRKEHRIDSNCKITIGSNEPIFINVIREGFYTFDVGIDLTNNEEDNFL